MTDTFGVVRDHKEGRRMAGGHVIDAERAQYRKEGPSLFWLAVRKVLLTVITLGIYRFWMTTHLRRHYWSAIRVQGDPFEYTGTGLEKLLGFLVAIIILAVYLGLFNLGLAFAGLFSMDDPAQLNAMLQISFLASLPLIYFATYRARRYIAARTRWRGIRFGMDQAAWGYTGRALLLTLLSAVTLGLAYPYQHFRLTKYMADRTWFGDLRFHQEGSWKALFGYWIWIYLVIAIVGGAFAAVFLEPEDPDTITAALVLAFLGYLAFFLIGIRYQVASFRYFWDHRTLGESRFRNDIDTGEVIGVYIGGTIATVVCSLIVIAMLNAIVAGLAFATLGEAGLVELFESVEDNPQALVGAWPLFVSAVLSYFLIIAFSFAFAQIFITRPILRRKAEGMQIFNAAALASSQQRAHDEAAEAGGFADALGVDIGTGF